jgi:two-component system, cell cycle sensor histidine kinase and response regulator CckA
LIVAVKGTADRNDDFAQTLAEVMMRLDHMPIFARCCPSLLLCLLALLFFGVPQLQAAPLVPRVLLLNSYNYGYDWSDDEMEGLRSALVKKFPQVELSVEHLDTKKFPQKSHFPQLASLYQSKYHDRRFDVVVALDNAAFEFAARYRSLLFPKVPLVFCGINNYDPALTKGQRQIAGVSEDHDSAATLSLALALQPAIREVLVMHDYSDTGLAMRDELQRHAPEFPGVKLSFLKEMPLGEAAQQLKTLPPDRAVLLLSYTVERGGRTYSQAESARIVSAASSVPVYAVSANQLGSGVVGGLMIDGKTQGQKAAELAIRIIEGEAADSIAVVTQNLSQPMFDYHALHRFHLDLDKLPTGAIIINEPVSSYLVSKTVFWLGAAFTASITAGMLILYLNVRRRKRLERVLRMTEAKFRQLFNCAGDAIYIHDLDFRILEVNRAACKLMGYSHDQLLSLTLDQINAPEQASSIQERVAMLQQQGSALYESLHLTGDGDLIPVEVSATVIEYEDEPAVLSIVRDISQRKSIELREKTRLQILEQMATGAPLEDLLAYIVRFAEQEGPGALCSVLLANESGTQLLLGAAPSLPAFYNEAVHGLRIKQGMGSCGTAAYLRKRVIVADIENHAYWRGFQPARDAGLKACWSEPVLSVDGELLGTFAVYYRSCRTPTAEELKLVESAAHMASIAIGRVRSDESRRNLELQMRQMQKIEAVGQLAAGLAHDFNNLLTPIFVYADIVRRTLPEGDPNCNRIAGIVSSAGKAADLTKQLLSFGRKQILKKEALELNEVVASLHDLLQRTIRANINIKMNLTTMGAKVFADRGQLEQILVNLAVNAQDAIEGNGQITIETSNVVLDEEFAKLNPGMKTGMHVLLSFTDDGCGMSEDVLHHMFEPFYTTKPLGTGTGLGLATVYGIVKQHNGYIKALSLVGSGTSLLIYLPRLEDETTPVKSERAAAPQALQSAGDATILVVDDNEPIREMALELLESAGYRVLVAETPGKAREMVDAHGASIDLLVTDVVMPEMSGPELYRLLALKYPELPVLYISGYTFDLKLHHRANHEDVNFLPKPFSCEQLLFSIQQALKAS